MFRSNVEAQDACVSSLKSLSVHRLEAGHYIAPLLCSDSLPFAVGLELFIGDRCQSEWHASRNEIPELEADDGLLSLQYILDGRGHVRKYTIPLLLQFYLQKVFVISPECTTRSQSNMPCVSKAHWSNFWAGHAARELGCCNGRR